MDDLKACRNACDARLLPVKKPAYVPVHPKDQMIQEHHFARSQTEQQLSGLILAAATRTPGNAFSNLLEHSAKRRSARIVGHPGHVVFQRIELREFLHPQGHNFFRCQRALGLVKSPLYPFPYATPSSSSGLNNVSSAPRIFNTCSILASRSSMSLVSSAFISKPVK